MEQAKPTQRQVIYATEMTLRLLRKTEALSPELEKSYDEVIGHLKHVAGPKYN